MPRLCKGLGTHTFVFWSQMHKCENHLNNVANILTEINPNKLWKLGRAHDLAWVRVEGCSVNNNNNKISKNMSPGPMIKKEQECFGKEMRAGGQWHGAVWSPPQSRAVLGRRSISINRDDRKPIWEADGGHCPGPSARPTAWTWPHVGLRREWHTQMCVLNVISVKGVPGGENTRGKYPWEPTGLGATVLAVQREQGPCECSGGS